MKDSLLTRWFLYHGRVVSQRPYLVMAVCVAFTVLCSMGMLAMDIDSDPDRIWVPPNSKVSLQDKYFSDVFNPFFRIENAYFESYDDNDVIAKPYLQKVMQVQQELMDRTTHHEGEYISLDDLCYKPIEGKGCLIESPSQYWHSNPVWIANDPSVKLTAACQTESPDLVNLSPCMDRIGTPVLPDVVFGGLFDDPDVPNPDPCGAMVQGAEALVLTLLLNNYESSSYTDRAQTWEKNVYLAALEDAASRLANDVQAPMRVSYYSERSVQDALADETNQNAFIVAVSYTCMFFYVSVALGKFPHRVRSRFLLGLMGIFIVIASLCISMGLCSFFGLEMTLIAAEVVPFLILAIGVDNMFIITKEFDRREAFPGGQREPIDVRVGKTMAEVGPSITAAAMSEFLAFSVGALTDIPALQGFCLVAAVAVLADYVLQLTWFAAAMSMDARRVQNNRLDMAPCLSAPGDPAPLEIDEETGEPKGQTVNRMIRKYYAPVIFSNPCRALVLAVYLTLIGLSIYGSGQFKLGLEQQLAIPSDSYLQDYFDVQAELGEAGPPLYIVLKEVDINSTEVQDGITNLVNQLSYLDRYILPPIYNWLGVFEIWLPGSLEGCDVPEGTLYEKLEAFLQVPIDGDCCQSQGICGAQYSTDIILEYDDAGAPVGIKGSRLRSQLQPLRTQADFINSYYYVDKFTDELSKDIPPLHQSEIDDTGGTAFAYSLTFVYYEQYTYIQGVAIQNVMLALGAVYLAVALLTNLQNAAFVTLSVLSIALNLVGATWMWNQFPSDGYVVDINAVTVVNLVMAVGLAVEFCVHIASSFLYAHGPRLERARFALESTGSSILTGITLTKLCGIVVLAFAPSRLFRLYFFRMYMSIIVLGAFQGLAVMPVMLSLFGPPTDDTVKYKNSSELIQGYSALPDTEEPGVQDMAGGAQQQQGRSSSSSAA